MPLISINFSFHGRLTSLLPSSPSTFAQCPRNDKIKDMNLRSFPSIFPHLTHPISLSFVDIVLRPYFGCRSPLKRLLIVMWDDGFTFDETKNVPKAFPSFMKWRESYFWPPKRERKKSLPTRQREPYMIHDAFSCAIGGENF